MSCSIAVGTAHGFTLFDYIQNRPVFTKCLLNPTELSAQVASNEGTLSRLKSFKKSLRESFRRRRRRGQDSPKKAVSPQPPKEKGDEGALAEAKTEVRLIEDLSESHYFIIG